jgi:tetratricopeptide (TPR) repeat protein
MDNNLILENIGLLLFFGAIGGLTRSILSSLDMKSYELKYPFTEKKISLGFLGDIFLGAVASVAAYTSIAVLAGHEIEASPDYYRLIGIGIIAGYAGRPVLDSLKDQFVKKIGDQVNEVNAKTEVVKLLNIAIEDEKRNLFSNALESIEKALRWLPHDEDVLLQKARIYKKLEDLGTAIRICNEVLEINRDSARAHFNLACYLYLTDPVTNLPDVLDHLKTAIRIDPLFKNNAKNDPDLNNLQENEEFKKIMG